MTSTWTTSPLDLLVGLIAFCVVLALLLWILFLWEPPRRRRK